MKNSTSFIVKNSIVVALYVLLTIFIPSLTFGPIQLRIGEILMFLALIDYRYSFGVSIGVFVSNLFSPLGFYDVIFGSLATILIFVSLLFFKKLNEKKKGIILIINGSLLNGLFVSLEYYIVSSFPLLITFIEVFISECIILIVAFIIYLYLLKNKNIINLIKIKNE